MHNEPHPAWGDVGASQEWNSNNKKKGLLSSGGTSLLRRGQKNQCETNAMTAAAAAAAQFEVHTTPEGVRRSKLSVRGGVGTCEGPGLVLPTVKGSLPRVTPTLLATLEPALEGVALLQPLSDLVDDAELLAVCRDAPRRKYGGGCAVADPRRVLLLAPAHPAHARPLPVSASGAHTTVVTRRGHERLAPERVVELAALSGADLFLPPAVEAGPDESVSRRRKCAAATSAFLDRCLALAASRPAFPAIVGSGTHERLFGFSIGGLGLGETAAERATLVRSWLQAPPSDDPAAAAKPRFVARIGSPEAVLELVALGVDFFCTDYPQALADEGYAIGCQPPPADASSPVQEGHLVDRHKFSADDGGLARENRAVLVEGCECHACKEGFSRAYIHHLRATHEMLGDTLLQLHNTHRYARWFAAMRIAIDAGRFDEFRRTFLATQW